MLDKKKKKKGHNLRLIERRLQDRSSRVTRRNVYKDVYKKKNSNWKITLRRRSFTLGEKTVEIYW